MRKLTYDRALRMRGRDFVSLACTPNDEPCTPAGADLEQMELECIALKGQMIRMHGIPPEDSEFFILHNYHDFGQYYELAIAYQDADQGNEDEGYEGTESFFYAMKCEGGIPDNWDQLAAAELAAAGHKVYRHEVIAANPGNKMNGIKAGAYVPLFYDL